VKAVFADTFYWIALTAPTDAAHHRAHHRAHQVTGDIVTTDESRHRSRIRDGFFVQSIAIFGSQLEDGGRTVSQNTSECLFGAYSVPVTDLPCHRSPDGAGAV
jgi:hypothetical protein